MTTRN